MDLHTSFFLLHCLFLISVESNAMINAFVSQFYIKCTKDVFKHKGNGKQLGPIQLRGDNETIFTGIFGPQMKSRIIYIYIYMISDSLR